MRFEECQREAIRDYVSYLCEQLDLEHWDLRLLNDPPDNPHAEASIQPVYGRQRANLRLGMDFFLLPVAEMEHVLTHEICHLLLTNLDDVIDNGPEQVMGQAAFAMFHASYMMHVERVVDNLAILFQQMLKDGPRRAGFAAALERVRSTD